MRIINTSHQQPVDPMGLLAFYSGMDNLTLFEINAELDKLLTPAKRQTYEFEMELQAPLLEMSLNGILVDQNKRAEITRVFEAKLQATHELLHKFCEAIGYYEYFISMAVNEFAATSGYPPEDLPRSWAEWIALPVATRREIKIGNVVELAEYHKALKEFGPPYRPGDRKAWSRKKNGAFNGNSPNQKLRLFYNFFGSPKNTVALEQSPHQLPPWAHSRGIKEYRTRDIKGNFTPAADRESLEKIFARGQDFDPRDAAYWAMPFITTCLRISDLAKSLGFLRCRLDRGYFKASFGAVTETGRLSSSANAQGYGSNAQNISPPLRIILCAEPGWKLATPDYEQIESRIVGAICYILFGASAYLDACECGDLHTLVCSLVWDDLGWPSEFTLDYLTKYGSPFPAEMLKASKEIAKQSFYRHFSKRDAVKRLGHGSNYLGQPRHMAKQTHIPFPLVEHFQAAYFEHFSEIRKWHQWVINQIQTTGELTTLFNRTRRFFGRPTEDTTFREAIAHEPQSTAADYTNRALIRIYKAQLYDNLPIKIFLQKHDEIGFRFRETDEALVVPTVLDLMREEIMLTSPDGVQRKWEVPAEGLTGWNLGHLDRDNPLENPDGLTEYFGNDERTRQSFPNNVFKWVF